MMKAKKIGLQILVLAIAITAGVLAGRRLCTDCRRWPALEVRAREYCGLVNASLDLDRRDLARTDEPARQRAAADRFMNYVTFHSVEEIMMCSAVPPDLNGHDACWLKDNFACLEKLAQEAVLSTKQPVYGEPPSLGVLGQNPQ